MEVLIVFSLMAIGYGLWEMRHPVQIARGNKRFVESSQETYFEQRRSWEAYGTTPPTEAAEVARRGRKEIIAGVLGLALAAVIYAFEQGAI